MNQNRRIAESIPQEDWMRAWNAEGTAMMQLHQAIVDVQHWSRGAPHVSFDAFSQLISRCENFSSFLDVGCGAGYYAKVLCNLRPNESVYHGCDASPEMINAALVGGWPGKFTVDNAESLSFGDDTFDVVMLGGIVGHTPDWRKCISEASRVAKKYLILHRVGCCEDTVDGVRLSVKDAYGHEIPEVYFNQATVLAEVPGEIEGEPICWGHGGDGWIMSALFRLDSKRVAEPDAEAMTDQ